MPPIQVLFPAIDWLGDHSIPVPSHLLARPAASPYRLSATSRDNARTAISWGSAIRAILDTLDLIWLATTTLPTAWPSRPAPQTFSTSSIRMRSAILRWVAITVLGCATGSRATTNLRGASHRAPLLYFLLHDDQVRHRIGHVPRTPREIRGRYRFGSPRPASYQNQNFLQLLDAFRRSTQLQRVPRVSRAPGHAARAQQARRRNGHARGPGAELHGPRTFPLRPQELLLPRPAQGLPNLAI